MITVWRHVIFRIELSRAKQITVLKKQVIRHDSPYMTKKFLR